ncbi:MAG: hypothetical protein RL268_59 [Pseudomonadota bacterium]|jgi:hypothetical protein
MPVIDHPVHAHGVRDAEQRYGCHNRPAFKEIVAINSWSYWPFRMSRECRYDRSLSDSACAGCCHAGSGERYVAEQEQRMKEPS